ncbi:MAG: hypothetical protein GX607_08950 [Myxococcales bacterium]|jgi:hypothetical protein|nr:hypothetical protein [Myxococcales bacterium]
MKTLAWTIGLGMLAATLVPGCGGDDGGGGGISSGVDPTKRGDELSDDEVRKICEAGNDYVVRRSKEIDPCRFAGVLAAGIVAGLDATLTDAQLQEACTEGVRACQQTEDRDPIFEPDEDTCDDLSVPEECSASVEEIERCIKDSIDETLTMFTDLPACGSITRDFLANYTGPEPQAPASCASLEETCPEALQSIEFE